MREQEEIRIRVPGDEKESSWIPIIILFVIGAGAWPLGVVGLYLLFKKLRSMDKNRKNAVYRQFAGVIGNRPYVQISELVRTLGKDPQEVEQYLQQMIDKGYMGKRAYIDKSTGCIVIDPGRRPEEKHVPRGGVVVEPGPKSQPVYATPVQREEKPKEPAKATIAGVPAPEEAQPTHRPPAQENEFEKTLREIREVNERIANAPMSEKIDRIGEITANIFHFVQQRPDRKDEVHKFMSYYLPTTMKLLESYSLLEKQSYQGENIVAARRDIEKIIDTMVPAFEKQLDRLFKADAIDISSDIDVLEAMMAKDGLTEDGGLVLRPQRR